MFRRLLPYPEFQGVAGQGAGRLQSRDAAGKRGRGAVVAGLPRPRAQFARAPGRNLNQTVAAAAAAYEQARTLIRTAQAALFPTVTASYSVSRNYTGSALAGGSSTTTASGGAVAATGSGAATSRHGVTTTVQTTQAALTWDLDVWGKIRRQIESNVAGAQVSAADLINAKLTAQAQLALAYFNLRAAYSLRSLLEKTAAEYKTTVTITRYQYKGGTVSEADLVAAETQYMSAQAAAISTNEIIAQLQHAIAMLIGKPPSEVNLPPMPLTGAIPPFPVGVPSQLLERRPDIAAAERVMQQENALIGVAIAAYYPDVSISADLGYTGLMSLPINPAHEFWSIGGMALETVFDGGARSAQVNSAKATYLEAVANYRQIVVTAFQQVEDQLAAIRVLSRGPQSSGDRRRRGAQGGHGVSQPISRRNRGFHRRRGGRGRAAGGGTGRAGVAAESLHRQRHPDRSAWRRLGQVKTADAERSVDRNHDLPAVLSSSRQSSWARQ